MSRVRCSPIWPPRWPTARTASTASGSAAGIVNMSSVPRRRRPRCGGWSTPGSTRRICPGSGLPARTRGLRRGLPGLHRQPMSGCTSMSMPPSPSTIPTTRRTRPRPGRRPGVITRCWCFWTAPTSPGGSAGRAAATGQRRHQHRRRPRHRAGVGAGIAAGDLPAQPGRSWRATDSGAFGFCRCDPHVRRRVPHARGWDSPSATPSTPGCATRWKSSTPPDGWYPAIDSDGDIRDGAWVAEATGLVEMSGWPAGTRLILRKERPHPGAQLRFTDSDGLRVTAFITDTAPRCGPRPARRTRTAPPPARPGGGPDPPGQGHRAAQPALPPRRRERRMAGNHHGRNRSGGLDQTASASPTNPTWPRLRDRHLPIPGPTRRRPHHPRRPTDPTTDRRHLAMGGRNHPMLAPTPRPLPVTTRSTIQPTRKTLRPWKARRRAPPADSLCPDATISPTNRPAPD